MFESLATRNSLLCRYYQKGATLRPGYLWTPFGSPGTSGTGFKVWWARSRFQGERVKERVVFPAGVYKISTRQQLQYKRENNRLQTDPRPPCLTLDMFVLGGGGKGRGGGVGSWRNVFCCFDQAFQKVSMSGDSEKGVTGNARGQALNVRISPAVGCVVRGWVSRGENPLGCIATPTDSSL